MNSDNKTVTYKKKFELPILTVEGDEVAEIVTLEVDVYLDSDTGEEVLTAEASELIESVRARRMGLMLPDEIAELRMRLGLTQKQISDLLQIGEKSYTRWETGKARPSRSINVLLCALRDGKIDLEYLRYLGEREFDWSERYARVFRKTPSWQKCEDVDEKLACTMRKQIQYMNAVKLDLMWGESTLSSEAARRAYTMISSEPAGRFLAALRDRQFADLENDEIKIAA